MNVSLSFAEGLKYVAIAVVVIILWRAWRARGGRGVPPTREEWEALRGQVLQFDRNVAHLSALSVTTRRALSLVLSSRAERPRIEGIPSAIGLLEGFGDGVSRQLRALSTMAVMTGLCATAIVFALTFAETAQRTGIESQASLLSLLAGVSSVYKVNSAAIFAAILIYGLQIHWRKQSDGIVELAADVLSELEEIPQVAPDPAILAALQQQHEHFERWSSGFFDKQLSSIQRLVEQVSFLSTGIQGLVRELISSRGEEEHKTDLAVREMSSTLAVSFERLDSRLDAGLRLLAQPFLQGLPGLEGLQKAAEALQAQDLAETIGRFTAAADRTSRAVEKLPAAFDSALSGVSAAVAQGTGSAVDAVLRSAGAETQQPLLASLSVLEASLVAATQDFQRTTTDLAQALHAEDIGGSVAGLRDSVEKTAVAVADLPASFRTIVSSLPDAVASGVSAAVGAAMQAAGRAIQQPLLERLTSVESAVTTAGARLDRSAGELRDTMQLDRLRESIAQLSGAASSFGTRVEALPDAIQRSLADLPEELSRSTQMALEHALGSGALERREPHHADLSQSNATIIDLKRAIDQLTNVLEQQRARVGAQPTPSSPSRTFPPPSLPISEPWPDPNSSSVPRPEPSGRVRADSPDPPQTRIETRPPSRDGDGLRAAREEESRQPSEGTQARGVLGWFRRRG